MGAQVWCSFLETQFFLEVTMIKLLRNEDGNIAMVQAGIYLIVLLVILYIGLTINQNVIDTSDFEDSTEATGVITFTGTGAENETINVSTETYTMKATPAAAFDVDIGANLTLSMTNLVAEINTNSTLLSAESSAGVGTITALVIGDAGNDYAFTTNVTDGSADAATLTGGVDADALYAASVDMDSTTENAYGMAGIMPIVLIAVAILASLLGIVYLFR